MRPQLAAFLALAAALVSLDSAAADRTSVTIYSTARPGAIPADLYRPLPPGQGYQTPQPGRVPGYGVVKQERELRLPDGRGELRFVDVAAWIDPTTVRFESLTDPDGTQVLEQSYQFDLVSYDKLLERYIDREITVEQVIGDRVETFTGTLLSASNGMILRGDDGRLRVFRGAASVQFPELPGGLITRPTLVWDVDADRPGPHDVRVTYQTSGITWWADYNLVFSPGADPNQGTLDVGAWVSILNQSGASYPEATIKLIAGDVQRAAAYPQAPRGQIAMLESRAKAPGFEEQAFFEYHLYTLGRPSTLPDSSTKQIELFEAARGVPAEKLLVYYGTPGFQGVFPDPLTDRGYGTQGNDKVDIYLRFENRDKVGLGIPLPSGRVRVNQVDPGDGSLEFIGEDVIDHTPKDETVQIRLGSAFDVVGERKQVDFRVDSARRTMEEEIEIKLRNHKDEAVRVVVKENLFRWTNWEILTESVPHEKIDARTVHFPVSVPVDGETTIRYRVRYTW